MPFAELVDSAYLSRMDSISLGAMGVAKASQNSVSKLYNSPLSKTTISLIASASANENKDGAEALSTAVSAAIILASLVGILQLLIFTIGADLVLNISGLSPTNSMYHAALSYTRARALGAPLFTLWLVTSNIFRGLGDAKSPLIGAIFFNVINILTDYIFLERLNLGIVGSAIAGTVAQATSLAPLLWMLHKKVPINLRIQFSSFAKYLSTYGEATIYLLGRSIARTAAYSYSSRRAALLGPVVASAYTIMYQIGLWVTMVCEGIAIANQSMFSRIFSETPDTNIRARVRHLVIRSCQAGILVAGVLSLFVYTFWDRVISVFTKNIEIQQAAAYALPMFICAQIIKGFSFPMNGIIMGGMDWSGAMWSMCASNIACFLTLRCREDSAKILWMAWAASYTAQGLVLFIRYKSKTGVWSRVKRSKQN